MKQFIAIRTYNNYINANMELGVVQQSGIHCYLQDEYTLTIDPLLIPALGGIKLMVLTMDAHKALRMLEENDTRYLERIACTSCGKLTLQKVINRKTHQGFVAKLWSRIVNGETVEEQISFRCYHCGKAFEAIPSE